jgi:hypothetical protein
MASQHFSFFPDHVMWNDIQIVGDQPSNSWIRLTVAEFVVGGLHWAETVDATAPSSTARVALENRTIFEVYETRVFGGGMFV